MNPRVQPVENMFGKGGGLGVFKVKLRADEVNPHFKIFLDQIAVSPKKNKVAIFKI